MRSDRAGEPSYAIRRHTRMRFWLLVMVLVGTSSIATAARPRLEFSGNAGISSAALSAAIEDPFDASGKLVDEILERDLLLISAYYWDRGYARAQVGAPVITSTTIRIPITENERFVMGPITVVGGPKRYALHLRAGDLFQRTAIVRERERLVRYYQERGHAQVDVLPRVTLDPASKTVTLTFEVERRIIDK